MSLVKYKIPNKRQILSYIDEAREKNKGPWDKHSLFVGEAAKLIAKMCTDLDEDIAYAMGTLHDIGRREGVSHMHHIISGYKFMMDQGFDSIGRICLTHSFPLQTIKEYFGKHDCSEDELIFINNYLKEIVYDDYDRLIQLCDCISLPSGYCLMEKRMIDVALRYGVNDFTQEKWKKTFLIKDYFEEKIGTSIYNLLPNVVENTFEYISC